MAGLNLTIALEDFVRYSMDQRLIDRPFPVETMFHQSTWDS
jgi:hypothetical protein